MSLSSPSASPAAPVLPRLTQAHAPLTHSVEVVNELGEREQVQIPAERPLTIYVDKRELVTLMTLGAQPDLLAGDADLKITITPDKANKTLTTEAQNVYWLMEENKKLRAELLAMKSPKQTDIAQQLSAVPEAGSIIEV